MDVTYIISTCEKYRIKNYTINDDGSIDVNGNVYLDGQKLTELPLNFNKVMGSLYCPYNKLKTLKHLRAVKGLSFSFVFCGKRTAPAVWR